MADVQYLADRASENATDPVNWESVGGHHKKLTDEFESDELAIIKDADRRRKFVTEAEKLLTNLRQLASDIQSTEHYLWLTMVATQWQRVFSTSLGIPKDISEELQLDAPRHQIKLSASKLRHNVPRWTRDKCLKHIDVQAREIGKWRKLYGIINQLFDFGQNLDTVHDKILSSEEEMRRDWCDAQLFFASDVLEGKIHLTLNLEPEVLQILTDVWLEDIKRMKAYLLWKDAGSIWDSSNDGRFYGQACSIIHRLLIDPTLKLDGESFQPIENWLRKYFVPVNQVDLTVGSAGWHLVRAKAQRIWEKTGREDEKQNWADAQHYVCQFYNHVIPALRDQNATNTEALLSAFRTCCGCKRKSELISAFEASLVTYFLDSELIKEYLPESSFV